MIPGELGSHFYVSAEGEYEVVKDGKVLGRLGVGKAFGHWHRNNEQSDQQQYCGTCTTFRDNIGKED